MKSLFLALILTLAVGGLFHTNAQQDTQNVSVRIGKQKKASRSKISIKFVSLIEDSRCPTDAQCIQAGNARIKITISKPGSEPKTIEVNSTLGRMGDSYDNYAITLTSLTPAPASNVRLNRNAYTATFSVTRLTR